MKIIILNCVPPFAINRPSPALSILKSWLAKYGFESSIIYWNLYLHDIQNDFVWNDPNILDTSNNLALYTNYFICKSGDPNLDNSFNKLLQGYAPRFINESDVFYHTHMQDYTAKLDTIIDEILEKIDFGDILFFGFSIKMDGWLASSIIAKRIKKINPDMPIVIGGINTKQNAVAFLENFHEFDIAMWGEGEENIIQLVNAFKHNNYDIVSNIAYKKQGDVIVAKSQNLKFADLSEDSIYPNYEDYFFTKKILNRKFKSVLPIEGSRGCHWNRCRFCYLNEDYKYRLNRSRNYVMKLNI